MNNDNDTDKISALLASTQQLRTHLSGLISNVMSFAIVTNIAVWTYSLQAYISLYTTTSDPVNNIAGIWNHSYVAVASTISLVLLFFWRLYTRRLDTNITCLYPEFIYLEGKLNYPSQYGTSGYLSREFGEAGSFLQDDKLSIQIKSAVISRLVIEKRTGARGHDWINWITIIFMLGLILIVIVGIFEWPKLGYGAREIGLARPPLKWLCGILSVSAFIGMAVLMCTWSRKPCKLQVENILKDLEKEDRE